MNKDSKNILDDNEVMTLTTGFMIGIGVLALPNALVKDAKQDAWISAFIGVLYPIVICFATIYICKHYPNDNILVLSKKYLGRVVGTICNFLFMLFFYIYIVIGTTGFTNIFRVYGTPFLTPFKIQIVLMMMIIYVSSKGIKVLAKLNEFLFYVICFLMISLTIAFLKGHIVNIRPILGSGIKNILSSSIESAYSYGGIEQILLIYPYMKNKNKLKSSVLKATFITALFYTWVTFISIYFMGYKITGISIWPIFLVTEGVAIPLINSLRSLFLLVWAGKMCTTLANEYTATLDILSYISNIKNRKILHIILIPLLLYLFRKIPNQIFRKALSGKIIPIITIYNLVYIAIIILFVFLDRNKANLNK